jgi:hypothetical protein
MLPIAMLALQGKLAHDRTAASTCFQFPLA